jgi:hypothetical protein
MYDETMDKIVQLEARVRQLERDLDYALQAVALLNSRYMALDERERRQQLAASRGVR